MQSDNVITSKQRNKQDSQLANLYMHQKTNKLLQVRAAQLVISSVCVDLLLLLGGFPWGLLGRGSLALGGVAAPLI